MTSDDLRDFESFADEIDADHEGLWRGIKNALIICGALVALFALAGCTVVEVEQVEILTPDGEPYMWIMPTPAAFDPRTEQDI